MASSASTNEAVPSPTADRISRQVADSAGRPASSRWVTARPAVRLRSRVRSREATAVVSISARSTVAGVTSSGTPSRVSRRSAEIRPRIPQLPIGSPPSRSSNGAAGSSPSNRVQVR